MVRHFQLGMPSLSKPSSLSFWGVVTWRYPEASLLRAAEYPLAYPPGPSQPLMIHPAYPHPCFSLLQLWDIRRKGCVFRYRVSMACVGYL